VNASHTNIPDRTAAAAAVELAQLAPDLGRTHEAVHQASSLT
jgi:hypothetical protein